MPRKNKYGTKSYMTLEYNFSGIRVQNSALTPVNWELAVDLFALEKKGKSRESSEIDAGTAYQRLYFWLDTNLSNVVVVDVTNEDDFLIANLTTNLVMFCPRATTDDTLIQLLHSKLSILAGDDLVICQIYLKSSDSVLSYTFESDGEYNLPATTKEYYTEGVARDTTPWWNRNDGFCFEFIRPADSELSDEELFKDISDPMDEFKKIVSEINDPQFNVVKEPAKILQIEKWKPKKVE